MVLVSVCTMGTSFVAISVFWAANVSEIVTISVFTTGGWGGREGGGERREVRGEEKKVSAIKPGSVKGRQTHAGSVLFRRSVPDQFHSQTGQKIATNFCLTAKSARN